jgi:hypothetical protein
MAALGWAMTNGPTGGSGRLLLAGTEVGTAVGPGAGRELMLIYVGRAFLFGMSTAWAAMMAYAISLVMRGV